MVKRSGKLEQWQARHSSSMEAVAERVAQVVADRMREYAPSARLAESVTYNLFATPDGISVEVGPGPEVPYAKYTEKPGSPKRGRMPWIGPALEDSATEVVDLVIGAERSS